MIVRICRVVDEDIIVGKVRRTNDSVVIEIFLEETDHAGEINDDDVSTYIVEDVPVRSDI